jgi:uncharacterized protein
VTGASAGIGFQLALLLARDGYDLVVTGRSGGTAHAADQLRDAGADGIDATAVQADLGSREGVERVWAAVQSAGDPLEVAVLNAGRSIGGAFLDTDPDDELALIDLNVSSVVHLAKLVVRDMAPRRRGRVLITSSVSATLPTPYETVYGPTRAFAFSFAEGLREEMKEHGVSVTAMLPGATDSDFHCRVGMDNTAFGPGAPTNSRVKVARQGYAAMMAGKDHVVAGDRTCRPSPRPSG